jgi:cupin 2 domain-containing protein
MTGDGAIEAGNLYDIENLDLDSEQFVELIEGENVKIERIVSNGQSSPPGFWYDQAVAEWVLILAGSAGLAFEGEVEVKVFTPGDHLLIPARQKHRVEWTDQSAATIWLAVYFS